MAFDRKTGALAALLALTAMPAQAAQFAIVDGLDGRPAVRIWGDIETDDNIKFAAFTREHPMFFSMIMGGRGGAVLPALRIGTFARSLNMQTVISAGEECASACALIWAAGAKRTLEPGARVGFHGIFTMPDGKPLASPDGNAIVGSYLGRLGYTDAAVQFMTERPPTDMAWLNPASAQKLAITYDVEARPTRAPIPGKPLPKPPAFVADPE